MKNLKKLKLKLNLMSTNNSFNLNLERLNRLNEKLNNVRNLFKIISS